MPGGGGGGGASAAGGFMQWNLPFAAPSARTGSRCSPSATSTSSARRASSSAQIALNARKNAGVNPKAIYRDPMTMDDYLDVRMISSPLCLFDCDVPCDGGTAVIVSHADTVADLRKPPIQVEAVGTALRGPAVVGPVRRPHDDGVPRRGRADVDPHRPHSRPTCSWPRCTTGSASSRWRGSRRWASAARASRGPFVEGGQRIARDGELAAEHARRAAVGGPAARLRVPPRGVRAAVGRGGGAAGAGRSRGRRGRRRRRPARRLPAAHQPPLNRSHP